MKLPTKTVILTDWGPIISMLKNGKQPVVLMSVGETRALNMHIRKFEKMNLRVRAVGISHFKLSIGKKPDFANIYDIQEIQNDLYS